MFVKLITIYNTLFKILISYTNWINEF